MNAKSLHPKIQVLTWTILTAMAPLLLAAPSWERPPAEPVLVGGSQALLPHPLNPTKILVASRHQIFEEFHDGSWKQLWSTTGSQRNIIKMVSLPEFPKSIFVLTEDGAFKGDLDRRRWAEIYRGRAPFERAALSFAISPEDPTHWFLGTEKGLFETDDGGKSWFRFLYFRDEAIPILRVVKGALFLATPMHLYRSEDMAHFEHVFSLKTYGGGEAPPEETPDAEEGEAFRTSFDLYDLVASKNQAENLWLATRRGVFESRNRGETWKLFSLSGLQSNEIRHLVYNETSGELFAGTPRGIYRYSPATQTWRSLHLGHSSPKTVGLAIIQGDPAVLVAGTESGFVRYPILPDGIPSPSIALPSPERVHWFQQLLRLEPTARELHKALIRYANVGNGKIKRWHAASRLASFLPMFSMGRDFSIGNNIDIDRGGTNDRDQFIAGPEDITRRWDANVSWDLGDFIWSSNQTAIDAREKLMVELRNDLLAEATRIYYERRRLQTELVFSPATSEQEHLERLTRLDELTSLLDGMTGGFFSKRLEKSYKANPDLEGLWAYLGDREKTRNLTPKDAKMHEQTLA